jgi:hypothetical protein
VRVLTKANPDFSLAIRNGSAVLVHANANDTHQQWVMDETYSTKVKDEASCPSFSLVNKATGQVLKHGLGETQPVLLTEYQLNTFDERRDRAATYESTCNKLRGCCIRDD